jgi:4-amino-4-deoxy-L-arabinose transferase-like glycosyltransferase
VRPSFLTDGEIPGVLKYFLPVLLLLSVVVVFLGLGQMDVVSDNEGQRTTPPAEMMRSGNWVIPTLNGEPYLAKPPLLYWMIAGVYKGTGAITPFVARIPTAVCAFLLVLAVYLYTRHEAGEMVARWAAVATLSAPYLLERARCAELDVPLTLACFLMVIAFRGAYLAKCPKRALSLAFYSGLALGAAIMLKGPVPLLFLWATWIALLLVRGEPRNKSIQSGIKWCLAALVLALALALMELFAGHSLSFPMALAFGMVSLTTVAWWYGIRLGRSLLHLGVVVGVGAAVAAPWAILVVMEMGWSNISALLHEQVAERTYTASRINSGSPLYFIQALPAMLAPWGFLLPLLFAPASWRNRGHLYRFSVAFGWVSVLVFSLIAGKEYEYILPAVPFLLIGIAYHLDELPAGLEYRWMRLWARWWQRIVFVLWLVVALGGAGYATIVHPDPWLIAEVWILAAVVVGAATVYVRVPVRRTASIAAMALATVLLCLLYRGHYYIGERSPRDLAVLTGDLIRDGYRVEAVKVYPAFAFYAGDYVPVETNPEVVAARMAGPEPYFYVTREKFLEFMPKDSPAEVLTGAYTNKGLVLVGNQPLPE